MKKIPIIAFILCTIAPCLACAQRPWTGIDMPFMPQHDTNHIHIRRAYTITDTVTMQRELLYAEEYDRHGYPVSPTMQHTYNNQGQLIEYKRFITNGQCSEKYQIQYTPEGIVQQVEASFYYSSDSSTHTYQLTTYKTHPEYGLLDCTYLSTHKKAFHYPNGPQAFQDTAYFRQQFDDQGHLLQQEMVSAWEENDFYVIRYHYDSNGRLAYHTGEYSESFGDSLAYQYDAVGKLISMEGKDYELEVEGDVSIRCHPDGRRIESLTHWHSYEDNPYPYEQTQHVIFDSRGLPISDRLDGSDGHYIVYEIKYWE